MNMSKKTFGNPILPGLGVCDPHIRIYDDIAYLYATHDSMGFEGFCVTEFARKCPKGGP